VRAQQRRSAVHRYSPIFLASVFTVLLVWPRLLGEAVSSVLRLILLVLILVEFCW
jgi:hypothetical protein